MAGKTNQNFFFLILEISQRQLFLNKNFEDLYKKCMKIKKKWKHSIVQKMSNFLTKIWKISQQKLFQIKTLKCKIKIVSK